MNDKKITATEAANIFGRLHRERQVAEWGVELCQFVMNAEQTIKQTEKAVATIKAEEDKLKAKQQKVLDGIKDAETKAKDIAEGAKTKEAALLKSAADSIEKQKADLGELVKDTTANLKKKKAAITAAEERLSELDEQASKMEENLRKMEADRQKLLAKYKD